MFQYENGYILQQIKGTHSEFVSAFYLLRVEVEF